MKDSRLRKYAPFCNLRQNKVMRQRHRATASTDDLVLPFSIKAALPGFDWGKR
jgi:hypothetical protein